MSLLLIRICWEWFLSINIWISKTLELPAKQLVAPAWFFILPFSMSHPTQPYLAHQASPNSPPRIPLHPTHPKPSNKHTTETHSWSHGALMQTHLTNPSLHHFANYFQFPNLVEWTRHNAELSYFAAAHTVHSSSCRLQLILQHDPLTISFPRKSGCFFPVS